MTRDFKKMVSELTLEEKAGLCSGLNFWRTKSVERLGIPSIMMTDGPHGLRKQQGGSGDHLGIGDSTPSTCFPSGAGLASSWNRALVEQVGTALGEECQAEDVSIVLGPALNIKRSPLCGRNFEYFSEDPFLSGELAASHIRGVQSQGVGTSAKHYAVNNQEHRRMTVDAVVDERTLREVYLAGFEGAVKQSQPWTVMSAYNKVNGEYASENSYLLTDILRNEWGFEGFVVSDWGAVNERVASLTAGLELEMPGNGGLGDNKIIAAVNNGDLTLEQLDLAVERILQIVFKATDHSIQDADYSREEHHQLARTVAAESMVLLKNNDNLLPLSKDAKIAIIGELAKQPRYQGGGSSHIVPTKLDIPFEEIHTAMGGSSEVVYAQGYELAKDDVDNDLIAEAVQAAVLADVAIVFAGLPDRYESEGYDRLHMRLPDNHTKLIEAIAEAQPNIVVVLSNGSPVEMPWIVQVKGVLETYLGGQASGGAIADLIFGTVNPSGKLAETFPKDLRHNPSHCNFPGEGDRVEYREGLLVGYKHYEARGIEPLFPFGHGLSYTTFEYSDLKVDKETLYDNDILQVSVNVKNTGDRAGKEVVQLYVRDSESSVMRPEKELKGFQKLTLEPGESQTVTFELNKRSFAYYHVELKDWHVETGEFEILIGGSSVTIAERKTVYVTSTVTIKKAFTRNSTLGDIMKNRVGAQMIQAMTQKSTNHATSEASEQTQQMMNAVMLSMPLRGLLAFSQGALTEEKLNGILHQLNSEV